ncbi:hypothetical protein AB0B45_23955 [Nonomuraea sp. NPDC049152]|uniref:hypothetical protein n=1 Tax=Nonomuraea sp. NPDC049152 TaxID=3154350 RepID=UPI0033EFCA5D
MNLFGGPLARPRIWCCSAPVGSTGIRIVDAAGGVTDEARANAAKHDDEEQRAALVVLIALINATNRLGVITRLPGGDHQPGQFSVWKEHHEFSA